MWHGALESKSSFGRFFIGDEGHVIHQFLLSQGANSNDGKDGSSEGYRCATEFVGDGLRSGIIGRS